MAEPATNDDFCRAAARAAERPEFLASIFARVKTLERLDDSALAHRLGATPTALCRIALCTRPRTASFRQDVVAIATRFGADPDALANVIRLSDALDALQNRSASSSLLAAARDAGETDDEEPES